MSNLSDRGTLRGTLQRNSGNYNDLINKPAINGHTLIGNQSGHALGLANEDDIIYVEANPLGHATADLHKILVDDTIYSIPDVVVYGTASGAIASFDDGGDNKPLKSLKVAINPVQAGTGDPSPQNVRPISGWTGANVENQEIYKRCIATTPQTYNSNGITMTTSSTGKIDIRGTSTANTNFAFAINPFTIPSENGRRIRFHNDFVSSSTSIIFRNGNTNVDSWTLNSLNRSQTYTSLADKYIDIIQISISSGQTVNGSLFIDFVVDEHGTTYPITWSDAGEVFGGYIDYERKKLVVNRFNYAITSTSELSQGGEDLISMQVSPEYRVNVIPQCECFQGITRGSSGGLSANQCRLNVSMTVINFRFSAPKTVDEWKTELENNPIKLILGLVTPIEYDLDEPVPTITTLLGDNKIWSDTGDILECVYQRDLNIAINKALSQ